MFHLRTPHTGMTVRT